MQSSKKNILIAIFGLLLALALFAFIRNPDLLSASILSLQDAETIRANKRDIWYKNEWNILDTFVSDQLTDINSLTFSIIYDPQDIDIDTNNIMTQVPYEIVSKDQDMIIIKFVNFSGWDYDYNQSLFELPYKWDMPQILISQWIANLKSWDQKQLSIWLLNDHNKDYHQDFN